MLLFDCLNETNAAVKLDAKNLKSPGNGFSKKITLENFKKLQIRSCGKLKPITGMLGMELISRGKNRFHFICGTRHDMSFLLPCSLERK